MKNHTDENRKTNTKERRRWGLHWEKITLLLLIYDMMALGFSYGIALWLRFDCAFQSITTKYLNSYLAFMPIYVVFGVIVFVVLKLYQSIWRFASFHELEMMCKATLITGVFHAVAITIFFRRMPISYYVFGILIQFILTMGIRFAYRFMNLLRERSAGMEKGTAAHVMIIGAGSAGQLLVRDIRHAREIRDRVVCFIDDNQNKWGRYIDGIPVIGGRDTILEGVEKYHVQKIYVAIPSGRPKELRDILNICKETGCELKNLPGYVQLVSGQVSVRSMREVVVEDLLGREQIRVDLNEIYKQLTGKVVLITGAGGSIGSELCRQVARQNPKHLILFDVYENNAYDIEQELKKNHPDLAMTVLIGSVRDSRRLQQVFLQYRPQIVYHAAAHKHVPLMEASPSEAIKNNTIGTYKTAYAAMMNGCRRFVLISTDKAVNPTNIMGASKRLCEMVIQTFNQMIKEGRANELPRLFAHAEDEDADKKIWGPVPGEVCTEFVAVRFGNVLGSNGSVIPLFKKQIAEGGPVTVTHPDIIRYFMTIPEAVSLVLQAGVYAEGGEIFVLDMGEPVKIDDLARNLIKLSGFVPQEDIKIEYVGLRPGEKLYEEKLMAEEGLKTTPNQLIHIGYPIPFDCEEFLSRLGRLMELANGNEDMEAMKALVKEITGTYREIQEKG